MGMFLKSKEQQKLRRENEEKRKKKEPSFTNYNSDNSDDSSSSSEDEDKKNYKNHHPSIQTDAQTLKRIVSVYGEMRDIPKRKLEKRSMIMEEILQSLFCL